MPFDDIVKGWESLQNDSEKNKGSEKAYMTQLNVVAGALNRSADRVDKADAHLAKLIAAYKILITELKSLEKEIKSVMKKGDDISDPNVGLMKGSVQTPVTKYRALIENNLASLLKEKRRL